MATNLAEQPVEQIPLDNPRFEQIFHRDHRNCECEMPMVSRKWNDALGTFVAIRLCCMAKALEELTGYDLYQVFEFEPRWEWDCDTVEPCVLADGSDGEKRKGSPPRWLRERLQKKGIPIHNLP